MKVLEYLVILRMVYKGWQLLHTVRLIFEIWNAYIPADTAMNIPPTTSQTYPAKSMLTLTAITARWYSIYTVCNTVSPYLTLHVNGTCTTGGIAKTTRNSLATTQQMLQQQTAVQYALRRPLFHLRPQTDGQDCLTPARPHKCPSCTLAFVVFSPDWSGIVTRRLCLRKLDAQVGKALQALMCFRRASPLILFVVFLNGSSVLRWLQRSLLLWIVSNPSEGRMSHSFLFLFDTAGSLLSFGSSLAYV